MAGFSDDMAAALVDITDGLGDASTYTPPGGDTVPLNLMSSVEGIESHYGETTIQSDGGVFEVAVSALALPVKNALIVRNGVTYKLKSFRHPPRDKNGLIWLLDCAKV